MVDAVRSAALRLVENDPPTILSVGTAVPRFRLAQSDMAAAAPRLFDGPGSEIERLMPVFDNAGIAERYAAVPMDWLFEQHGWRERNQLYVENALELLSNAASEALDEADRKPSDIAAVVVVSTTALLLSLETVDGV